MAKKSEYTVAQVQLFLIDKILRGRFPPRFRDFVGSGKDVGFFGEWSRIVREHFSDDLSKVSLTFPAGFKRKFHKEFGIDEKGMSDDLPMGKQKTDLSESDLAGIPNEYYELLSDSTYFEYLPLLEDKELGRLMLIEYPQETELIKQVKEQAEPRLQDDEKVFDEMIRRKVNVDKGAISDELYKSITELDLSDKGFKTLPAAIGKLTALKTLFLHDNQLTTVPDAIGKLTALEWLSLYGNQLTTVPDVIGKLTALKTLSLGENQLTTVPDAIGKLTALEWLYLGYNQFSEEDKARIRQLAPQSCKVIL